MTEDEKQALEEKTKKLKKKLQVTKQEKDALTQEVQFLANEVEQLKQIGNHDQGENLEQSQNLKITGSMLNPNGEFLTDIGNETRYNDLEKAVEQVEREK